jgi:hypothetical protein
VGWYKAKVVLDHGFAKADRCADIESLASPACKMALSAQAWDQVQIVILGDGFGFRLYEILCLRRHGALH